MPPLSPLGTLVTALRSALFSVLFYGMTVFLLLACLSVMPFGARKVVPLAAVWSRIHRFLARWVLGQKIVVEGAFPDEPVFIVSKHESMFETLDAVILFHRPVIAAKRELGDIPVWGAVARAYGLMIVDRAGGASALRGIRAEARSAFAEGRPVLLYPEGTRVPHGERAPLKAGFAGLYTMLGVPVLPVALDTGRLSPRNSFLKRSGVITYRLAPLIPPGLPRAEAERQLFEAINSLNGPAAEREIDSV
ncbi:lysophospholipid acyltransferase family protein [Sphingobium sp. B12D2B]|uniref:lysophospholipid acyltransferase family protein n=1 Tax=Sphingobium sp. B12D2B TaxID=2940577 RepID=UPI002225B6A8|nr:lysophospholipid acyltransferase family protein [Sphingobium sp. B12D2B]MCW2349112.1 1-acyl-sn-glycerol-3-phosphate acyltransferase [Sphingobium sp. B12D2B]